MGGGRTPKRSVEMETLERLETRKKCLDSCRYQLAGTKKKGKETVTCLVLAPSTGSILRVVVAVTSFLKILSFLLKNGRSER